MEIDPEKIVAHALELSGIDPATRDRVRALLATAAGLDSARWFGVVDDSPYPLAEWLRALGEFDRWLSDEGIAARPVSTMLGYLECCTLSLPPSLPLPEFSQWLTENLRRHGFDATREVSGESA